MDHNRCGPIVTLTALVGFLLMGCFALPLWPVSTPVLPTGTKPNLSKANSTPATPGAMASPPVSVSTTSSTLARPRNRVIETEAYKQLPEITIAANLSLVTSPSHPQSTLPAGLVPAGTASRVIGTDQNGAWLLIVHGDTVGWMPSIYSRGGSGTLKAMVVDVPANACTAFLGVLGGSDGVWESAVAGTAMVQGLVYRPQPIQRDAGITLTIEGWGQASAIQPLHKALLAPSELLVFNTKIDNLKKGSRVRFQAPSLTGEPYAWLVAFFTSDCTQQAGVPGMSANNPGTASAPTAGPVPPSTPLVIVVESGGVTIPGTVTPAGPRQTSGAGGERSPTPFPITVSTPIPSPAMYYYALANKRFSSLCLGVRSKDSFIEQRNCSGAPTQSWGFQSMGGGFYQLVNKSNGSCMTVQDGSRSDWALIVQSKCEGADHQQWRLNPVGDFFQIVAKHSGQCVDEDQFSRQEGLEMQQGPCGTRDIDNQLWQRR